MLSKCFLLWLLFFLFTLTGVPTFSFFAHLPSGLFVYYIYMVLIEWSRTMIYISIYLHLLLKLGKVLFVAPYWISHKNIVAASVRGGYIFFSVITFAFVIVSVIICVFYMLRYIAGQSCFIYQNFIFKYFFWNYD